MQKWKVLWILFVLLAVVGAGLKMYLTIDDRYIMSEKRASPQGQLPLFVEPLRYDLKLRIDPDESQFTGKVKIKVDIKKPTKEMWLHGKGIEAENVLLHTSDGIVRLNYQEMGHSGVVRLSANRTILPQIAEIEVDYQTYYNTRLAGLYKVNDGGLNYIFSQFEAIDARKALVSFDEPRFKVKFDLTLEIPAHLKGFTNTPLEQEQLLDDGFKRLSFATTKPLPTYLLAFAVGDFDVVDYDPIAPSEIRQNAIPLRGIATKGKGDKLHYALANSASILETLENYFGTPYPYEKLDLVAVPDFAAGGMENAGLITYREQLILLGDNPDLNSQRNYASIHAHELAHQWFGNLVTMPWWDDLWLNEAFATWMANRAMTKWNDQFESSRNMVRWGHQVMRQDGLISARKVREPIHNNDVIENAFDRITYRKGGAVLQMFERFVGEQTFREGVQYHVKRFAHGHATAFDFIESLEHVSDHQGLASAFFSFLTQPGVPTVKVDWQCHHDLVTIEVDQQRYLPLGSQGSRDKKWGLPVCLSLLSDLDSVTGLAIQPPMQVCEMISQPQQTFEVESVCPASIMPNNQGSGYYRFSYDQRRWYGLLSQLEQLSVEEKYAVANNLAAAFRAGDIDASFYIHAAQLFTRQQQWDLVIAPIYELKFISDYIASQSEQEPLSIHISQLYSPVLARLGLDANTPDDRQNPVATALLRKEVISFMALRVKDEALRESLLQRAKQYIGYQGDNQLDKSAIIQGLAATAMAVAVQELGQPYFDALSERIDDSNDSTFRQAALQALGSTTDPQLSAMVRSKISSLSLKNSERGLLIIAQLKYKENHQAIYDWAKTYFAMLSQVLPERMVESTPRIALGFCSLEQANDVEQFFSQQVETLMGAKRNLAMTLEQIRICAALKAHQDGLQFAAQSWW